MVSLLEVKTVRFAGAMRALLGDLNMLGDPRESLFCACFQFFDGVTDAL